MLGVVILNVLAPKTNVIKISLLPVSATSWQHCSQMFCNFYAVKNHKIAKNSTTTNAREKISTDLESSEFFCVCLTKFKNNQILLD